MLGSDGAHVHEELSCAESGVCVVMEPRMAVSLEPTNTNRSFNPGAMETAWVMSMVCSVSSQTGYLQFKEVPSVETPLIGTLLVCLAFLK